MRKTFRPGVEQLERRDCPAVHFQPGPKGENSPGDVKHDANPPPGQRAVTLPTGLSTGLPTGLPTDIPLDLG